MTEEEMAKQYAEEVKSELSLGVYDRDEDYISDSAYNDGFVSGSEEGFLAGLKAGRPQWHKADVPTTPINKVVLGYIKGYNSKKFCLVKWNGEWWYDARTYNDEVKVIAWCEIPQFKE